VLVVVVVVVVVMVVVVVVVLGVVVVVVVVAVMMMMMMMTTTTTRTRTTTTMMMMINANNMPEKCHLNVRGRFEVIFDGNTMAPRVGVSLGVTEKVMFAEVWAANLLCGC